MSGCLWHYIYIFIQRQCAPTPNPKKTKKQKNNKNHKYLLVRRICIADRARPSIFLGHVSHAYTPTQTTHACTQNLRLHMSQNLTYLNQKAVLTVGLGRIIESIQESLAGDKKELVSLVSRLHRLAQRSDSARADLLRPRTKGVSCVYLPCRARAVLCPSFIEMHGTRTCHYDASSECAHVSITWQR